jgi:hypothetical protein
MILNVRHNFMRKRGIFGQRRASLRVIIGSHETDEFVVATRPISLPDSIWTILSALTVNTRNALGLSCPWPAPPRPYYYEGIQWSVFLSRQEEPDAFVTCVEIRHFK